MRQREPSTFYRNALLAGVAILVLIWGGYFLVGRFLILSVYEGEGPSFLNHFISGRELHPASHYLQAARDLLIEVSIYLCLFVIVLISINAKVFAVSLLLIVGLIEGSLVAYEGVVGLRYPTVSDTELLWVHDPLLGWKKGAHLTKTFSSAAGRFRTEVTTNSKGLRDEEYNYEKMTGVKRILLLGDSFVVGTEVRKESLLDTKLEELLASHGNFEVINAGTRGYGTDQLYLYLISEGYRYQPDVVIYVFYPNDLVNNVTVHTAGRKFGKSYYELDENGELSLRGTPVPKKFKPHQEWRMATPEIERLYNEYFLKEKGTAFPVAQKLLEYSRTAKYFRERLRHAKSARFIENTPEDVEETEWKITEALIVGMREFSESIGARFLVYEARRRDEQGTPRRLGEICKANGIEHLLAFETSPEYFQDKNKYHIRKNIHWNDEGHALVAREIYRYLAERK